MKKILGLTLLSVSLSVFAGFEGFNSAGTSLKVLNKIKCSTGLTCTKVGDKFNMVTTGAGVLQNRVLATATTITSSQCGSTFYNSGAVQMELPVASGVLGCRLNFVVAQASNFDINPAAGGQIMVLTNAVADAIRSATVGNTVVIEAASGTQWSVISTNGTWTDIN